MCLEGAEQVASGASGVGSKAVGRHPVGRQRRLRDPVRLSRMCGLIERTVGCTIGPSAQMLSPFSSGSWPVTRPPKGCNTAIFARQMGMYLGHVSCGLSYTDAGHLFGRDRTTASHACTQVENRREDPQFDHIVELLERCVRMGLRQIEPVMATGLPDL